MAKRDALITLPWNGDADWSDWEPITTRRGKEKPVRKAVPSPQAAWDVHNERKDLFTRSGYQMSKYLGTWELVQWAEIDRHGNPIIKPLAWVPVEGEAVEDAVEDMAGTGDVEDFPDEVRAALIRVYGEALDGLHSEGVGAALRRLRQA